VSIRNRVELARSSTPPRVVAATPTTAARGAESDALCATLAAPPTVDDSNSTRTTGTGASGEIRSTAPVT
jgi:hypothetical protein